MGNRIQLNRLLGLSNLYYIDPEDQEILQELRQVRLSLIEAIERCPESELEHLWATDLGDRYWALVRSGIQKKLLNPRRAQKAICYSSTLNPETGGGFGQPGAVNAFLIAMVLFEPGSMRVDGAEHKLPGWLFPQYQQVLLSLFLLIQLDEGIQMRILFSHNNFPAQFRRLAPALAEQGHDVVFLAQNREWHAPPTAGVRA